MRVQTYSGRLVDVGEIKKSDLSAIDIAESLSKQCRFNGHTKRFYSVAEHCYVASLVVGGDRKQQLAALVHDANEAYIGDWPAPLKKHPVFGAGFVALEESIQSTINEWLGLSHTAHRRPAIVEADQRMLATECRDVLEEPAVPWVEGVPYPDVNLLNGLPPKRARNLWLSRLTELFIG